MSECAKRATRSPSLIEAGQVSFCAVQWPSTSSGVHGLIRRDEQGSHANKSGQEQAESALHTLASRKQQERCVRLARVRGGQRYAAANRVRQDFHKHTGCRPWKGRNDTMPALLQALLNRCVCSAGSQGDCRRAQESQARLNWTKNAVVPGRSEAERRRQHAPGTDALGAAA